MLRAMAQTGSSLLQLSPGGLRRGSSALYMLKSTLNPVPGGQMALQGQNLRLREVKTILKACPQFNHKSPNSFVFSSSEGEVNMLYESISGYQL